MFTESNTVEDDLSPQPPSLQGKGSKPFPSPFGEGPGERSYSPPLVGEGPGERFMPAKNIVIGQKVSAAKVEAAKQLRHHATPEENLLWQQLRRNQLNGSTFAASKSSTVSSWTFTVTRRD